MDAVTADLLHDPELFPGLAGGWCSAIKLIRRRFYRFRWGFILLGGLALFVPISPLDRPSKTGKSLSQGIVPDLEQDQFFEGERLSMLLQFGHADRPGMLVIFQQGCG